MSDERLAELVFLQNLSSGNVTSGGGASNECDGMLMLDTSQCSAVKANDSKSSCSAVG